MDKPEVFRMYCTIGRAGRHGLHHIADLIFENGDPFAVITWTDYPDGSSVPDVAVRLEPEFLSEFPGKNYQYLYQIEIADPRPLN